MAGKISEMDPAATLTGAELVEVVQDGVNVRTTTALIAGQSLDNVNLASYSGNYKIAGEVFAGASPNGTDTWVGQGSGPVSGGVHTNTGGANVGVGLGPLAALTTGGTNAAVGTQAGASTTAGVGNSFFGNSSGIANTTGSNNSFFGKGAGSTNTTGSSNTLVGRSANVGSTGLTNATAIGATATVSASNSVVLGNTSVTLVSTPGAIAGLTGTAIPAGGAAGSGLLVSSTTNFGVFFGSGAPTLSAAKGSLYLRSDGSSTSTRMYVNTDGSTTWTAVTTAA